MVDPQPLVRSERDSRPQILVVVLRLHVTWLTLSGCSVEVPLGQQMVRSPVDENPEVKDFKVRNDIEVVGSYDKQEATL